MHYLLMKRVEDRMGLENLGGGHGLHLFPCNVMSTLCKRNRTAVNRPELRHYVPWWLNTAGSSILL